MSRKLIEISIAFLLLCGFFTFYPVVVELVGDFKSHVSTYVFNPLVNFMIGNSIVIALLLLYRKRDNKKNSSAENLHFEYFHITQAPTTSRTAKEGNETVSESSKTLSQTKPVVNNTLIQDHSDEAKTMITKAVHLLQRTKSEILDIEIEGWPQRKLRQSESEINPGTFSSFETVNNLSSEEFKHTIEAFIAKHQRFLWAQKMDENRH